MADGTCFLSYSRAQFYFSEAVNLHLQKRGIQTWFDMQRLEPGSDWRTSLESALQDCTALILIASQSALKSEYVRQEVATFQAARKPIYILLFEAVELPPDLAGAVIFDCRSRFARQVEALTECIRSGAAHRERIPRPNFLHLPTRLPLSVAFVSWLLFGLFLLLLLLAMIPVREYLDQAARYRVTWKVSSGITTLVSLAVLWVFAVVESGQLWWAFTFRRPSFNYGNLRFYLLFYFVLFWGLYRNLCGYLDFLIHGGRLSLSMQSPPPYLADFFLPAFLLAILLSVGAFFLMSRSADLLRWLPAGVAPQNLREKHAQKILGPETVLSKGSEDYDRSPRCYRLLHDPNEAKLAAEIQNQLGSDLLSRDPGAAQDGFILLLSNNTRQSWLDTTLQQIKGRLFTLVATSIRAPGRELINRFQWFDYREQTDRQLARLETFLRQGAIGAIQYFQLPVPESLARQASPSGVFLYANALRFLAAINLAAGLFAILYQVSGRVTKGVEVPASAALCAVVGLFFFWLADACENRKIPFRLYLGLFGAGWLAMLLAGLGAIVLIWFGSVATVWWIIIFIGPVVSIFIYRDKIIKWLPGSTLLWRRGSLAAPADLSNLLNYLVLVVFFVFYLVSITTEILG